jgi:hypothetical protein
MIRERQPDVASEDDDDTPRGVTLRSSAASLREAIAELRQEIAFRHDVMLFAHVDHERGGWWTSARDA